MQTKIRIMLSFLCSCIHLKNLWKNSQEILTWLPVWEGFPGGSDGEVSACNAGDLGYIPGSGRFPGEGNGNPLRHSCLENPMDEGA